MLGLRNDPSLQTDLQFTSCFMLGRGHHTVRHKGCWVESEAPGSVGHFGRCVPRTARLSEWAAALFGIKLRC